MSHDGNCQDASSTDYSSHKPNKENEGIVQQKKSTESNPNEQPEDFCALCKAKTNQDFLFHFANTHWIHRTILDRLVYLCPVCSFRSLSIQDRDVHFCMNHMSANPTDMVFRDVHSFHCYLCTESCNNGVSLLLHLWLEHPNAELPVEEPETLPPFEGKTPTMNTIVRKSTDDVQSIAPPGSSFDLPKPQLDVTTQPVESIVRVRCPASQTQDVIYYDTEKVSLNPHVLHTLS
ncbi:hypothetical protein M3Y94_00040900 [Aphelenchoides besseyi]|nr:hypothetical protein M3Y94_00040900 [Aphelenchoides besseyi]